MLNRSLMPKGCFSQVSLYRRRRQVVFASLLSLWGCGDSGNPNTTAAPAATKSLSSFTVSSDEQNVIPPDSPFGVDNPDEHVPFLRQANGSFRLWLAGGGSAGTFGLSSSDLMSFTSLVSKGGAAMGVLLPSGPGTTAFDADYAGAGSVFPAANGTDLLMIYHAENHLFNGVLSSGNPFYAAIGLARSSDGGVTWTREGEIIGAHDPQLPTQTTGGAGALTPSAVESGGYIYVIFREIDPQSKVTGFALARAPIAIDGVPGSWQKYSGGAFSTAGLGGAFTPLNVVLDPTVPGDMRQPQVSFNVYLQQFLMVSVGNGGIYAQTSADLINWTPGVVVLQAPVPDSTVNLSTKPPSPFNWYPTIISMDQPSDQMSDQTGYIYYAKGTGVNSEHLMYRRAFNIIAK
ncbi:hypothetical protein [Caballeronia sordidicola]|uniref:Uncharacterized protein n=1 Tax=Caballeronia sordidicola TaxID=196367 RepID=A0A242MP44_CABSO|nr:hypothetical protein [Caballeronia sordidicola]OTP72762.1 hypothetical protein PAMC26577_19985 [Caballeronia sordidicola]